MTMILQQQRSVIELIDTLWNVNCFQRTCKNQNRKELIDTLWNVNVTGEIFKKTHSAN